MADIELVIKISEEDYKIMKHNIAINNPLCPLSQEEMVSKVANGTPLPKCHGAIVDLKQVIRVEIEEFHTCKKMVWNNNPKINNTLLYMVAPTIIEADKEDE